MVFSLLLGEALFKKMVGLGWMGVPYPSRNPMQILGGYGYTMEHDMQRHFRDAKINGIGGGSSQIQRLIIAREMGL